MGQGKSRSATARRYLVEALKMLDNTVVVNDAAMLNTFLTDNTMFTEQDLNDSQLLHKAARRSHVECVRVLLEHGACVHVTDDLCGMTPLHFAAMGSHKSAPECIGTLVKFGADPNDLGDKRCGKSALHIAMEYGNTDCVEELVRGGCDVDQVSECDKGISPVILAIKESNVAVLKLLLEGGADIHKCWTWVSSPTNVLDVISHKMEKTSYNVAYSEMFSLLIQSDMNLLMTLQNMPQGQTAKVTAVSVFSAMKTVLERLNLNYYSEANNFVMTLVISGYTPRGEAMNFIQKYDRALSDLVSDYLKGAPPLADLCVRVLRRTFRKNVMFGVRNLKGKISPKLGNVILLASLPQPSLIKL